MCGIVLPLLHEKVFDQKNQRPIEVLYGCVKLTEYPIGAFDAGGGKQSQDAV